MNVSTVAKRYALALFQLAKEKQLLDQLEAELRVVKEVTEKNPDLFAVLKSPKLSKSDKKKMVETTFSGANPFVLNLLKLLVDRHRQNEIGAVADEFIALVNDEKGIAQATVTSVRMLTEEESQALSSSFAAKVGKKSLKIENTVDSKLLGGLKVRIGNRIFDGSLQGKLERLERQLLR
jgi:F-type H+-transporting ATPase subunit delta